MSSDFQLQGQGAVEISADVKRSSSFQEKPKYENLKHPQFQKLQTIPEDVGIELAHSNLANLRIGTTLSSDGKDLALNQ